MSSSICPHFTQNAWKKDLCSNCFKSKDEHKAAAALAAALNAASTKQQKIGNKTNISSASASQKSGNGTKTDYPNKHKSPAKSIIKKALGGVRLTSSSSSSSSSSSKQANGKANKVSFHKQLHEVIGYGGEWSDHDSDDDDDNDDDHDFMNLANEHDDMAPCETDDEETMELKRLTRANTDFNMNNGNLLGDAEENIKKSFAALKLGAPQIDKEGKKQTLKINVVPFGAAAPATTTSTAAAESTTSTPAVTASTNAKAKTDSTSVRSQIKTTTTTTATATATNNTKITKKVTTTLTPTLTNTLGASGNKSTIATATATVKATTTTTTTTTTSSTTAGTLSTIDKVETARDGKDSPPIERAMEKSLLDEISETLEQKQNESKKLAAEQKSAAATASAPKIKFELTSLSETIENKPFLDLKKSIARNAPITKDHAKPKVNVCHKFSDTDSNCSDTDNGVSAYYDVVETQISYENLPDGKYGNPKQSCPSAAQSATAAAAEKQTLYSSSQYITDMLLSSKTRAASYNLHEGNFMTSKITSDGLIVTKCSSDDALDSTGSSFDGSSDEEATYNMIRSESDSGIGISIGNEYKNVNVRVEKKLSASTNNSDYEDIQIIDQAMVGQQVAKKAAVLNAKPTAKPVIRKTPPFTLEKSRELHGEPDGSADPDNSLENKQAIISNIQQQQLPALPKSPPPPMKIDARPSFLHGLQKQQPILLKKPEVPAKPLVSPVVTPLKTFMPKRQPNSAEQQLMNQLQSTLSKSNENLADSASKDDAKLKKGRAPNPPPEPKSSAPPTPERDYNLAIEFEAIAQKQTVAEKQAEPQTALAAANVPVPIVADAVAVAEEKTITTPTPKNDVITPAEVVEAVTENKPTQVSEPASVVMTSNIVNNIYTRKSTTVASSTASTAAAAPVIREKDKRERATINPKFRSLNTFVTQRANAAKNMQLQTSSSVLNLKQPMTPEPTPRNSNGSKNLSMSEECLAADKPSDKKASPTKTKAKFSIKKFLRMGSNTKTADNLHKRETVYTEICTGEDAGVIGKPRLVIIHPIDINPTAVEVVKDITKTSDPVTSQTVAVVTATPPAPPLRALEGQRLHEISKPARPPPPKSAELRRKQKTELTATLSASSVDSATMSSSGGSIKSKADNVYANLGEIRSSIAPRKPERTASMREREAQLELARKRQHGAGVDTISICSSNGENVSSEQQQQQQQHHQQQQQQHKGKTIQNVDNTSIVDGKPPTGSRTSTFERKKTEAKLCLSNKMEIFEERTNSMQRSTSPDNGRPSSLKDSVRKINNTIDSYLKDKRDYENMYDFVKTASSPPPPPVRSVDVVANVASVSSAQRLLPVRRNNLYSDTASIASYTRSEYGPVRSNYGLNNSLANIPRMISASYAGSEVGEFDIYAPYSYYGSEAGGDVATDINDSVWGLHSANKNRVKATNRLRMRKGRSVVHKNIEDNYTAVVVANHEALAQVLDQLQQTPVVPPALRPLANAINLRYEDFTILEGAQAFVVGKKAFHAALWTTAPVTLALSADCNQLVGAGGELSQLTGGASDVLNPITEFCDLVPSYQLPLMPSTEVTLLQATISVLPRLQLETLQSIGAILKGKSHVLDKSNFNFRGSIPNLSGAGREGGIALARNVISVQNLSTLNEESVNECKLNLTHGGDNASSANGGNATPMPAFDDVMSREVAFIMLQLVNGMKNLQAKAIEEMPISLSNVVLSKDVENKDAQARLCVLQGNNNDEEEPMGTLCKCAHIALNEMLPTSKITPIIADILQQERAESLSKAKSVLEFALWGPSDVVLSGSTKERELALQRWLDLERATVLHGLVRTRVELTVYDECHLMFLVRSTAKMMNDAAKIVCGYQQSGDAKE